MYPIPAKQFAVVADNDLELEENLAMYEADNVDVTIAVDDTLCKGVESWGWYGLQPINQLTSKNGTLLVTIDARTGRPSQGYPPKRRTVQRRWY